MTKQEMQEIYNRLLELTKGGKVKWEKVGRSEYVRNFSQSSVAVEKDWNCEPPMIVLKIYNQDGHLIAIASDDIDALIEEENEVERLTLDPSELFDLVQSQVYKYSETTTNLLDELRKLEPSLSERRESK